jgi:hypothetical protein
VSRSPAAQHLLTSASAGLPAHPSSKTELGAFKASLEPWLLAAHKTGIELPVAHATLESASRLVPSIALLAIVP